MHPALHRHRGSGSNTVIISATARPLTMLAAEAVPHNSTQTRISQHSIQTRSSDRFSSCRLPEHRGDVLAAVEHLGGRAIAVGEDRSRPAPSAPAPPRSAPPSAPACPPASGRRRRGRPAAMSSPVSSSSADGAAAGRSPSGASARAARTPCVHTRATTYSVSRLVITLPPTSSQASTEPSCGTRLQQRDLADEPRERRNATEIERGYHEDEGQQRARRGQAAEALQRRRARLPLDQADDQEQRGLHEDVVGDVVDRARHARARWTARCRTPCSRCG